MEDIHRLTEFERQYLLQDRRNSLVDDGVATVDVTLGKRANKRAQFWTRPGSSKGMHGGPPADTNRIPGIGRLILQGEFLTFRQCCEAHIS